MTASMSHDLPSISFNTAKVIKIICYDLPYVKDNGATLFCSPKRCQNIFRIFGKLLCYFSADIENR